MLQIRIEGFLCSSTKQELSKDAGQYPDLRQVISLSYDL
jgi:hypothetical protein